LKLLLHFSAPQKIFLTTFNFPSKNLLTIDIKQNTLYVLSIEKAKIAESFGSLLFSFFRNKPVGYFLFHTLEQQCFGTFKNYFMPGP
jgi:hypothetical protein